MRPRLPPFWALQLGGWLAFGAAMTLSRVGAYPLGFMLALKGLLTLLGFGATLALRPLYRRVARGGATVGRMVAASVAGSYAASLAWTAAYNLLGAPVWAWHTGEPREVRGLAGLLDGSVYHAFALLAWSVLYFGIKYHRQLDEERERALRAESAAHRARLQALRYQLNPHFLFNTLNAVSTLVVEHRNDEAGRMISRLSDFLRLTLEGSDAPEVPLAEELEWARRYLEIEAVRFEDRLRVAWEVEPGALAAAVPGMLLQPLVENAVRHAVAPREEGGRITVRARRAGDRLLLAVEDDGPGVAPGGAGNGRGIGLANTRERLRQAYGPAGALEVRPGERGGTAVSLRIPFRPAAAPSAPSPEPALAT
ncbi:MAG TPA: histidine kinase [Longimicrobiaceae bacterium]|nr:histidine kinase [Longimicrobiaceae bacterium]